MAMEKRREKGRIVDEDKKVEPKISPIIFFDKDRERERERE